MKVEKDTPRKPEVLGLATLLDISPAEAFGRCFLLWCWADAQTGDGFIRFVNKERIDELAGLPGFANALVEVGWLRARNGAFEFPNFSRHMGQSAKTRALKARWTAEHRAQESYGDSVEMEFPPENTHSVCSSGFSSPNGEGGAGEGVADAFEAFWVAYPRKQKRQEAVAAWRSLNPDMAVVAVLMAALERHKRSDQWQKRKVIPNPGTWLKDRRWEDGAEGAGGQKTRAERDEAVRRQRVAAAAEAADAATPADVVRIIARARGAAGKEVPP